MSTPRDVVDQKTTAIGTWVRRLVLPRSTPAWLLIYARVPNLRFPLYIPLPVGWARDIIRGARLSIGAMDRVTGGRARSAMLRRLPPAVDWYGADLQLEKTLPKLLYGAECILDELLAGNSYTLVEVNDEDVSIRIRVM